MGGPARKAATGGPVKGTCPGVRSDTSHVAVPLATKERRPITIYLIPGPRQLRSSSSAVGGINQWLDGRRWGEERAYLI